MWYTVSSCASKVFISAKSLLICFGYGFFEISKILSRSSGGVACIERLGFGLDTGFIGHAAYKSCICISMKYKWLVEFLQRELELHSTACLLRNTSTDVNSTVMSWCILLNKTCILESLGENVGLHSGIIPKRFLKIRLNFPARNCPNIWQKILTILSVTTFLFLESNVRPARRADNLATICEPIV
jgi:hypothetical protein